MAKTNKTHDSAINLEEFDKLDRDGWSGKQIADHFGVSPARISQKRTDLEKYRADKRANDVADPRRRNTTILSKITEILNTTNDLQDKISAALKNTTLNKNDTELIRVLLLLQKEQRAQFDFYDNLTDSLYNKQTMVDFMNSVGKQIEKTLQDDPETARKLIDGLKVPCLLYTSPSPRDS